MKKQKILEECEWILTEEAKKDSVLNPIDKNVLVVLQFMKDNTETREDGFFEVFINKSAKVKNTLTNTLEEMGVKADYTTVMRAINKLCRLGYIDYKRGFWSKNSNYNKWPEFRILKGTVDSLSSNCSDIAITTNNIGEGRNCNNQITDDKSATCSDIATPYTITYTKSKSPSNNTSVTNAVITYSKSDLELEKNDYNKSDVKRNEDTTLFGDGDGDVDLKQYLSANVCDGNVMGDVIEWAIEQGWFSCDVQVQRVLDATKANCDLVALNEDYYLDVFNRQQEKNRFARL